jgi:hypothetical protein
VNGNAGSFDGTTVVNRLAQNVENTAQSALADRRSNRSTSIPHFHAANETVRWLHRNATHDTIRQMGGNFKRQSVVKRSVVLQRMRALDGIEQLGLMTTRKLHIDDGTHDLRNFTVLVLYIFSGAVFLNLLVLGEELFESRLSFGRRLLSADLRRCGVQTSN